MLANNIMHDGMAVNFACDNVVADFMRSMVPHHQGAIDMCKILLKLGDPVDEALRLFCDGWSESWTSGSCTVCADYLHGIVGAQTSEILLQQVCSASFS